MMSRDLAPLPYAELHQTSSASDVLSLFTTMESLVYVPTYEVFVILEAFRDRFDEHLKATHALFKAIQGSRHLL